MKHKPKSKTVIHWKSLYTTSTFLQMIVGVGLAILALKGFMMPNHFLDGGVTGVSILIHELTHISIIFPLLLINLCFVAVAYHIVSREVAVRSLIAILLLIIGLETIHISPITTDKLLISIFGGVIIGIGMGLVIRSGGILDGSEIIAVLTTRRVGLTMSEVILAMNILIFLVAAFKLGLETAMYSILTYFAAGRASDYVADGLEEYNALTIISGNSDIVKSVVVNDFGKGITIYKGERGYLPGQFEVKTDCDIIVTIVTRLELLGIKKAIQAADPVAFMYVSSIKETSGGVVKKKHSH